MSRANNNTVIPKGIPYTQVPWDAIQDTELTPIAFRVYAYLLRRTNDEHRAWPSQRTIAKDIGINKSSVAPAVELLKSRGWLTVYGIDTETTGHRQKQVFVVYGQQQNERADQPDGSGGRLFEPDGTVRTEQPDRTESSYITTTNELPPTNTTISARKRNHIFDWFVDRFNMPTGTDIQKARVGRLVRETTAALQEEQHVDVAHESIIRLLDRRAQSWPNHFPDATLTPEAFAKWIPTLARPPIKGGIRDQSRAALESLR